MAVAPGPSSTLQPDVAWEDSELGSSSLSDSLDRILRTQSSLLPQHHPSPSQALLAVGLVFIGPLVTQLVSIAIPLAPPIPGFKNNLALLLAYVPYVCSTIGIGALIINAEALSEPRRWTAVFLFTVLSVFFISLLCEFVRPFPLFLVNSAFPALLFGIVFSTTIYLRSPRRFTKEFNKLFAETLKIARYTNGFYFIAVLYLVAFFKIPNAYAQFVLTLFFHVVAWGFENACLKVQRDIMQPTFHHVAMMWFQMMGEVFTTLTFPIIEDSYFIAIFILKFVFLSRFPFLMSEHFWEFSMVVRNKIAEGTELTQVKEKRNTPSGSWMEPLVSKQLAKILWYFVPTSYSYEEYAHRVMLSFCFTMYSYICAPIYYLVISPVLRYGYNKDYYNYANIPTPHYKSTLIYTGISIAGYSLAFILFHIIITKAYNYRPIEHWLYKMHVHKWYFVSTNHNALLFTMTLLVQHLNFFYSINKW